MMDHLFGRRFLLLSGSLALCGAFILGTIFHQRLVASREYAAAVRRAVQDAALMRPGAVVYSGMVVPPGVTFSDALAQMEIAPAQAQEIVRSAKAVVDLGQARAGGEIDVGRSVDGRLREVRYKIDADRTLSVRLRENEFSAEIQTIPSPAQTFAVSGTSIAARTAAKSAAAAKPHLQTNSDSEPPLTPASLR